ncbi:hypothetical protein R3Q06_02875 [Rhodococcus erythropolis]|uniref:hypothetical protein n=1 Tax=Rhodococcus erythropolis TaxID=1833 RepID=UPI0029490E16|nr:hypothetical protein [Rhodococcus erythropolis]MDV6272436.1 hypothetical protein [Rhodococcus erythropolis]
MSVILEGDVVTSADVAILPPAVSEKLSELARQDGATQVAQVTMMLSASRTGLLAAIAAQDLPSIVEYKAKASAIQDISKQLRLGKELQLDAAEFVRRAERGLGVGIREGQAKGTVNGVGTHANRGNGHQSGRESLTTSSKVRPTDLASQHELHGANNPGEGIYAMTDNVTDEQFEEALAEAKDEGNLSRANVARKAKAKAVIDPKPEPAKKPAEPPARPKGKKFNSANIIRETSIALEGLVMGVELAYIDDLDTDELKPYIDSINSSLRTLAKFSKGLKNV